MPALQAAAFAGPGFVAQTPRSTRMPVAGPWGSLSRLADTRLNSGETWQSSDALPSPRFREPAPRWWRAMAFFAVTVIGVVIGIALW